MKALILNSGMGRRMGVLTSEHPKCMTEISGTDTILSRQLKLLLRAGIREVVITTGFFDKVLVDYCESLDFPLNYTFVKNPIYKDTNYIYSIYCAREHLRDENIVLMHGDLVFDEQVLLGEMRVSDSVMAVSSTLPLPEKDFKAVVKDGHIKAVGIEFFEDAFEAQALYKLNRDTWNLWLCNIIAYCESGEEKKRTCYAEAAFNEISDRCIIYPYDCKDLLCAEIDDPEDLKIVSQRLVEIEEK